MLPELTLINKLSNKLQNQKYVQVHKSNHFFTNDIVRKKFSDKGFNLFIKDNKVFYYNTHFNPYFKFHPQVFANKYEWPNLNSDFKVNNVPLDKYLIEQIEHINIPCALKIYKRKISEEIKSFEIHNAYNILPISNYSFNMLGNNDCEFIESKIDITFDKVSFDTLEK